MNMDNSKNKNIEEIKKIFKKTTIYVVRCDKKNELQESAPCENCLEMIINLNIKRIVFSSKDNQFISAEPRNLQINHISAGNKFLNKKNENKKNENKNKK